MKTAIEWLVEKTRTPEWHSLKRGEIIEQADKMFKEQIVDALHYFGIENAEQYYNETFKK